MTTSTNPYDPAGIRDVVLLGFPDVELLDLTGPYEVLSSAARFLDDSEDPGHVAPRVRLAAPDTQPLASRNGMLLQAHAKMSEITRVDLVVVPGGRGVRALLEDEVYLEQLAGLLERAQVVLSVCTGSLLLARLGLLADRDATTHHLSLERLRELAPTARVHEGRRWVEDGHFVISAGVSSGIDASLHVTERIWGAELASSVAGSIEYPWKPGDGG